MLRVTAPPVERAANEAAIRVIAEALGVPASDVVIERGAASRRKVLSAPASVRARLAALK